jgi:serine/threonine-protein kinase
VPTPLLDAAPHLAEFPGLVAAVSGCLEKDPAQRPQTATGLFSLSQSRPELPAVTSSSSKARPPSKRLLAGAAGVVVVLGLGLVSFLSWFNEPVRKAHRLVANGRGSEALQVIEDLGAAGQTWPLQQLRATALHQVGRHEEEWKVMGSPPENEPTLEPLALEALADDFGHAETARLRKLLAGLPKAMLMPTFQTLAKEAPRWAQWGAVRFLDLEYAGQGVSLLDVYVAALENRDCGVRRVAARRLIDFRSPEAMPALEKLKALPRKKGEEDCGQAAAAAALEKLAKE